MAKRARQQNQSGDFSIAGKPTAIGTAIIDCFGRSEAETGGSPPPLIARLASYQDLQNRILQEAGTQACHSTLGESEPQAETLIDQDHTASESTRPPGDSSKVKEIYANPYTLEEWLVCDLIRREIPNEGIDFESERYCTASFDSGPYSVLLPLLISDFAGSPDMGIAKDMASGETPIPDDLLLKMIPETKDEKSLRVLLWVGGVTKSSVREIIGGMWIPNPDASSKIAGLIQAAAESSPYIKDAAEKAREDIRDQCGFSLDQNLKLKLRPKLSAGDCDYLPRDPIKRTRQRNRARELVTGTRHEARVVCEGSIFRVRPKIPAVTLVEALDDDDKPYMLAKEFSLSPEGKLVKGSVKYPFKGYYKTISFETAEDFLQILRNLKPNEALMPSLRKPGSGLAPDDYGDAFQLCEKGLEGLFIAASRFNKTAEEKAHHGSGSVTRTAENFGLTPGHAGIAVIDYDPPKEGRGEVLSREALWEFLTDAIPGIKDTWAVWCRSSSSSIGKKNPDGSFPAIPVRGQRFYIPVADIGDTQGFLDFLHAKAWLSGLGWVDVAGDGKTLVKSPIDTSLGAPVKLDFAGNAIVSDPIVRIPDDHIFGNPESKTVLDTSAYSLTKAEKKEYDRMMEAAVSKPEIIEAKRKAEEAFKKSRVEKGAKTLPKNIPEAERKNRLDVIEKTAEELTKGITSLPGDWPVEFKDGSVIPVREILSNPAKFSGRQCLDPLEPDYQGGKDCAKIFFNASGKVIIYSQAHGGKSFELITEETTVLVELDDKVATINKIIPIISGHPEVFRNGDHLVRVNHASGDWRPLTREDIQKSCDVLYRWLRSFCRFEKSAKGGRSKCDLQADYLKLLVNSVNSPNENDVPQRAINSKATAPWLRLRRNEGGWVVGIDIVSEQGYDEESGIYSHFSNAFDPIPPKPSRDDVAAALRFIHENLLSEFQFTTGHDCAAAFAGIFMAACRSSMTKSYTLFTDASTQGSGKTLLARVISNVLSGGTVQPTSRFPKEERDVALALVSAALEGAAGILYDNVTGTIQSEALAAYVTSGYVSTRLLYKSEDTKAPWRGMIIFTGNNASFKRDISERTIRIRLEKQTGKAFNQSQDGLLLKSLDHRMEFVRAVFLILTAYFAAGGKAALEAVNKQSGMEMPERLGRVDEWDALIREPILWLIRDGFFSESGVSIGKDADPGYCVTEKGKDEVDMESVEAEAVVYKIFDLCQAFFDYTGRGNFGPGKEFSIPDIDRFRTSNAVREMDAVRAFNEVISVHRGKSLERYAGYNNGKVVIGVRLVPAKRKHGQGRNWVFELVDEKKFDWEPRGTF
jgi:hypothetical protein